MTALRQASSFGRWGGVAGRGGDDVTSRAVGCLFKAELPAREHVVGAVQRGRGRLEASQPVLWRKNGCSWADRLSRWTDGKHGVV